MKILITFILVLLIQTVFSQQLRIGVLRDYKVSRIVFAYNKGSYSILADSTFFGSILPNEFVELSFLASGNVKLRKGVTDLGEFRTVKLLENVANSSITLSTKSPVVKDRKYKNDFEIKNNRTSLDIINLVDMNNYLGGVVESEGGGGKGLEYYKVQALMSRTYALKYRHKHESEGFDLCDRVHCQAYHSMLRFTPRIDSAVRLTSGVVMKDVNGNLVDAYFHANCGGQTSEPDIVWNNKVPYLTSFKDTFCIYTKQATWEKKISKEKWVRFLVDKYNYPISDSVFGALIFTFNQQERLGFYQSPVLGIPLRDIRLEFNLKSTYFNAYPDGEYVVLRGKGFGHGVGLCQEGAMRMSNYGYNYLQIAQYYFPGAVIVNLYETYFFNQVSRELQY